MNRRWIGCALLLAAGLALWWGVGPGRPSGVVDPASSPSAQTSKPAPAGVGAGEGGQQANSPPSTQKEVTTAASAASSASSAPDQAAAATAQSPKFAELCGLGRVPVPVGMASSAAAMGPAGGMAVLAGPLGDNAIDAARARVLPLMATGSPHSRAAAMLWQADGIAGLVALARETQDAAITAMALARCSGVGASEACRGISARDWVRVDSKNAAAWLALAATPEARPPPSDAEISAGLRQSTQFKQHHGHLAAAMLAAAPADVPAYVQFGLFIEATGIEAALPDATFRAALRRCQPSTSMAAERLADCTHLAEVMVARGDSVMARNVGTSLGELSGWPATRVAAIKLDTAEVSKLMTQGLTQPEPLGCASVEPMLAMARDRVRAGEMAAWRNHISAPSAATAAPGR
jgi:hypothetical protein